MSTYAVAGLTAGARTAILPARTIEVGAPTEPNPAVPYWIIPHHQVTADFLATHAPGPFTFRTPRPGSPDATLALIDGVRPSTAAERARYGLPDRAYVATDAQVTTTRIPSA